MQLSCKITKQYLHLQLNCIKMIPQDFEAWHYCITKMCGIPLCADFAKRRLAIYKQDKHPETIEFIWLYGLDHYRKIVSWLEIVEKQR